MKLIVQIPCFNEADTLPQTVAQIPRNVEGVDLVEILVVDDGSTDDTCAVAERLGVEHIIRHKANKGLARAFRTGIEACLARGADVIVNTDGDNQYPGALIPDLVRPIVVGQAEIVIGDRCPQDITHFSWMKQRLQTVGSFVVRRLSGTNVPDTVSGFRAMTREAAIDINILSPFSYTIEMLIQAGEARMAIRTIKIPTNPPTRESRLFKSIPDFLRRSLGTIVRIYTMYYPLSVFFYIGLLFCIIGVIPIFRFLYFFVTESGAGHIQSLILGAALTVLGFLSFLTGLLADLVGFNRKLIEETLRKVTRLELEVGSLREPTTAEAVEEADRVEWPERRDGIG